MKSSLYVFCLTVLSHSAHRQDPRQIHSISFTDIHPMDDAPERHPGIFSASAPAAGHPKVHNVEMDPHEGLIVAGLFGWVSGPLLRLT